MAEEPTSPFERFDFVRQDESDDGEFYEQPRLVVHIDDGAITAIGELLREVVPQDSVVLDLMSSWRSHWPKDHPKARMVGLGLNAVEMERNPDLDDFVIHNLNKDPGLPFGDDIFDAVVVSVSIQYMTSPIEVFREVNRILKPGGAFVVAFSNRMFPTKAVWIWRASTDEQRMNLVGSYFHHAGNYEGITGMYRNPGRSEYEDPMYVVLARKAGG